VLIGFPAFAKSIAFTPVNELTLQYMIDSIIVGAIGSLLAIFIGVSFQGIGKAMDCVFKDRFIERVMAAGVIIAIVGYFVPELMFSGEVQIYNIIANPVAYGALILLGFAILKVLLLALSFKSGYLGGAIFPTLFAQPWWPSPSASSFRPYLSPRLLQALRPQRLLYFCERLSPLSSSRQWWLRPARMKSFT
jgi:H+/Cl- antiporter ClcA